MAGQVPEAVEEDPPPLDPEAVRDAYRMHRARRRLRVERSRRARYAGARFWLVLLVLLAASVALGLAMWREVEKLFGL